MSGRVIKEEQQEANIHERLAMTRRLLTKTVMLSLFFIAVDASRTVWVREFVGVFVVTTHVLGMALCVLATRLSLREHRRALGDFILGLAATFGVFALMYFCFANNLLEP